MNAIQNLETRSATKTQGIGRRLADASMTSLATSKCVNLRNLPPEYDNLNLSILSIRELSLMFDTLTALIAALVGAVNQPRCTAPLDTIYDQQMDAYEFMRDAIALEAQSRPDLQPDLLNERRCILLRWACDAGESQMEFIRAVL